MPEWVKPGALFFITIVRASRGQNQLGRPTVSSAIFDSVAHRQGSGAWLARLVVLRPDPLHALVAFQLGIELQVSIRLLEGNLACKHGIRWQCDFFDHRLRHEEAWGEKAHYVRMNPVRAGLAVTAAEWPYFWEPA